MQLPANWRLLPLPDCMSAIIDYRGRTPRKVPFGVPLITAKIVKDGRILEPEEFIAEEEYDNWMQRGLPNKGDVVFTTEAPLGEVAQLDGRKVALAQRLITLRGKPDILDNNFLKFLMQSDFVQEQLHARSTGTTVLGIRQSELRKLTLTIPPLDEQRAIACILGALDDKIELNRETNRTLEALAQSLFKSWFVDFDPVTARAAGRAPFGMDAHTAALFPARLVESELGLIPEGWRVGILRECCLKVESGGTPSRNTDEYWEGGTIRWLTSSEVRNPIVIDTKERITVRGYENSSAKLWKPGTSVVAMYGATAGEVCLLAEEMTANQACCGLIPKENFRTFLFVSLLQSKRELAEKAFGSAQQNLNQPLVANSQSILPSDDIVQRYEQRTENLINRWIANEKESVTLAKLRDALLPKLLSGEIRVREAEREMEQVV